ncbi:MAG TPA: nitrous oxide reductase family maturation protein NosD, partial [Candidatus Krumholzibacteria bacterium]|nr:nitrous oxide reductase family maturation protein NosD [Candidatus Krumholzibacteria bacterium]
WTGKRFSNISGSRRSPEQHARIAMKITAATILIIALAATANAAAVRVGPAGPYTTIAAGIAAAQAGDTVAVANGLYNEHGLVISQPIVLVGTNYPVIDGQNGGDIIVVTAPGVVIRGLSLRNVGASYVEDRAAIRVRAVDNVEVDACRFDHTIFGIYVEHANGVVVTRNVLSGGAEREVSAGNGIHLWYCKNARIEHNEVHGHRDGIYFEFVENSLIRGNLGAHNIRYGLHFMFSPGNEYVENRFESNGAGVAVMYTQHVTMRNNVFSHNWGPSSYGLLLKEIGDSEITGNHFIGNTVGLHAEGSNRLRVTGNEFVRNGYAARIMANSMDGTFTGNDFVDNAFDVVTNSRQNFNTFDSNYWSTYRGYDLDRNGVGDVPFHPVRLFSLLVEKTPPASILLGSLFVNIIDVTERVMPVFTPEALVDRNPRMNATSVAREVPAGAPDMKRSSR